MYEEGTRVEATTNLEGKPESEGGEIKQTDYLPEQGEKVIGSSIAQRRMMIMGDRLTCHDDGLGLREPLPFRYIIAFTLSISF
jgi:hypothetical protein